jgi:hypothetical protein
MQVTDFDLPSATGWVWGRNMRKALMTESALSEAARARKPSLTVVGLERFSVRGLVNPGCEVVREATDALYSAIPARGERALLVSRTGDGLLPTEYGWR